MGASLDRIVIVALLLGGLALAAAAGPRAAAHVLMSLSEREIDRLQRGEPLSPAQLQAAIDSRHAALRWADLPDAWIDLGGLYMARAGAASLSPRARRAVLDQSLDAFRRGLALGPDRPYAWTQYAQAAFARGLPGQAVSEALGMSLDLGAAERPLVIQRVRLGFRARNVLTPDVARRIAGEVRLMAEHETFPLAEFARAEFALAWIRAALRSDPALLGRFDAAYLRLPPA